MGLYLLVGIEIYIDLWAKWYYADRYFKTYFVSIEILYKQLCFVKINVQRNTYQSENGNMLHITNLISNQVSGYILICIPLHQGYYPCHDLPIYFSVVFQANILFQFIFLHQTNGLKVYVNESGIHNSHSLLSSNVLTRKSTS